MRIKIFFIMIITLLAALYGAAQPGYFIYEGVQTSHFVDDHQGSEFSWRVLAGLNPDIEANSGDYTLVSTNGSHTIEVLWENAGLYYLDVMETDITGCTNRKVIPVNVIQNNRSIRFETLTSSDCYTSDNTVLSLQLITLDEDGQEIDASYFPIEVDVLIENKQLTFNLDFDNMKLEIPDSLIVKSMQNNSETNIKILAARDVSGNSIEPVKGSDLFVYTVYSLPKIQFTYSDNLLDLYGYGQYIAEILNADSHNSVYQWWMEPSGGTTDDLQYFQTEYAGINWGGEAGIFRLYVTAIDGNGCAADTIFTDIEIQSDTVVTDPGNVSALGYAGPDTIIGACQPYQLMGAFVADPSFTYEWEPADNLSDATVLNPVFTPGITSTYFLRVTDNNGNKFVDTLIITVSQLIADAGEDVLMEQGTTILLDGSGSSGEKLIYKWTTNNGLISSGENTPYPEVEQPGEYFLEVEDIYGCWQRDTVIVTRLTKTLIANDDYDTTTYRTAIQIYVLENDIRGDWEIDPMSLQIVNYPSGGTADVNLFESTITYTPGMDFTGTDVFEYKICDTDQVCDNAKVYVLVSVADFLIPQAFTPNGDNINDFFEIVGIEYYANNSITIINRWGKKVYEARAYGIDTTPQFWDGKSNVGSYNDDLPTGTYFYVLDLGNGEKPIAGSVYLDR